MTADTTAPTPTVTITEHGYLPLADREPPWELYRDAMTPLAARAAQRHLLTRDEFRAITADDRITKYLAHAGPDLIGIGVSTTDLAAWPLISPAYYHQRFPDRPIWYIGFVAVAPRALGVFAGLIERMSAPIREAGGVAAMDFCAYNLNRHRIDDRIDTLLKHIDPTAERITCDEQEFHTWGFGGAS